MAIKKANDTIDSLQLYFQKLKFNLKSGIYSDKELSEKENLMPSLYQYSDIPCVAPLRTPCPLPNATLLSLFLFIRHGARTPDQMWHWPGNSGDWHCNGLTSFTKFKNITINNQSYEYYNFSNEFEKREIKNHFPPTCIPGALLDTGINDLIELGKLYQQYAVSNIELFSPEYNQKQIYLRSSFVTRCIESALSFLNGFYQSQDPINETINILTGKPNNDPLFIVPGGSELMLRNTFQFIESDECQKRIKRRKQFIQKFDNYLNVTFSTHEMQSLFFGDYLNTLRCSGQELNMLRDKNQNEMTHDEPIITPEIHEQLLNDVHFVEAGFIQFDRIATMGPILKLILNRIDSYYGLESHCKFSLFSGHDATLLALLTYFGVNTTYPPPFASHVALEFWYSTRPYLRVVFNGDVITTIPLSQFKKEAGLLVEEYEKKLKEKPEKYLDPWF